MKTKIVFSLALILGATTQLFAYDFCNKSDTPITVIVSLSQAKAEECLRAMGWHGAFPHTLQQLRSSTGQFTHPQIFVAQHWFIAPTACAGTNWRDLQKGLEDTIKNVETLYFMAFEAFDKTGSTVLNFLASGSFNVKNTVTISGSHAAGFKAVER